jgi:outer membrane protein insertion porin family
MRQCLWGALLRNTRKTVAGRFPGSRTTPPIGCALDAPPEGFAISFSDWSRAAAPFALLLSCTLLTAAQDAPPKKPPPPGVLHSVAVKGNSRYASDAIIQETRLKIGQPVSAAAIEQARINLQATELFNNVSDGYRFAGNPPAYDVTFTVTENEQVFPIRFERLGVPDDALRGYLKEHVELYSDQIPGADGVLRRYTQAVQSFVSKSNPSVKVKALISNEDPQQLAAVFTSDIPAPTISQVVVSGNQAVDTGTILRAVNQVAIGVPLSDLRLKQILNGAIRPLYAAKGYAAVTFPKIETEPSKTNQGVVVKVQILDGPVFKFGRLHFHGEGMDQDEIRANIPFKPGQTFNGRQVDDFRLWLVHSLRRRGELDASVTTDIQPDDAHRAVDVAYNVFPGGTYTFQKLDVQGLDVTTTPVIERLWGEKPGKPFNPDYPDFFLKRVQEQGIFDNLADTSSDYTADASTHNVTVHLYFKGGKSKATLNKEKKEEQERRQGDGTWSPFPPLFLNLISSSETLR